MELLKLLVELYEGVGRMASLVAERSVLCVAQQLLVIDSCCHIAFGACIMFTL
jgi:hypothetical protein